MIRELHIKNIAVIEEITISFGDGFHALTGETGAGKSILIDSINMALGGRTTKELIRTGAESASVDVVFELSGEVEKKLLDIDIESEDGMLYISRQITTDGKSKCKINGHMVPLSVLKDASEYLLTIHGQNDNQSILSPKSHIGFVDSYGNYDNVLSDYKEQYNKVKEIKSELLKLITDETEKARRIDLLTYQINEIATARLNPGEEEELEERREYLANIEDIVEKSGEAYSTLYGDEQQNSAYDLIATAVNRLEKIHTFDVKLDGYYTTLNSVLADLEDVTHELKNYVDDIDYSQGELDTIEERLSTIQDLKRKYGETIEDVLAYLEKSQKELSEIEDSEARQQELTDKLVVETEALRTVALKLSDMRRDAAIRLQTDIMEELSDLDMQKMRFSVAIELLQEENGEIKYTNNGCDRVEFMISCNPGEELKPLSKIASGGEMSRIMLAIKSVLANSDIVETLIFDEIDTGVSGRAAQKIAEKICMLSKRRQILCITHLAQIASMADTHFMIEKNTDDQHTRTSVTTLESDQRKNELARIIGGVMITDITLSAAQEMLDMAESLKLKRDGVESHNE